MYIARSVPSDITALNGRAAVLLKLEQEMRKAWGRLPERKVVGLNFKD